MSAPVNAGDLVVEKYRDDITAIDRELLALVNRRLELVAELWHYKEEHQISFHDPAREEWLRHHLEEMNHGPLSHDGLLELHRYVLDLTKRELERG